MSLISPFAHLKRMDTHELPVFDIDHHGYVACGRRGCAVSVSWVRLPSSAAWASSWNTVIGTAAAEARAVLMSSRLMEPFQSTGRRCGRSVPGWYP